MKSNALQWASLLGEGEEGEGMMHVLLEKAVEVDEDEDGVDDDEFGEDLFSLDQKKGGVKKLPEEPEELRLDPQMQYRRKGDLGQPDYAQKSRVIEEDSYAPLPELVPY